MNNYNPTDDELRAMARDHDLYDATHRDLARLVLREREALIFQAHAHAAQIDERMRLAQTFSDRAEKAEAERDRLKGTVREALDLADRREDQRDQARAALARLEALRDGALKTAWACPCTGPYTHGRHDDGSPGEFCGSSAHDEAWRRFSDLRAAIAGDPPAAETCLVGHEMYGACELPYRHDGPHSRIPGGATEPNTWFGPHSFLMFPGGSTDCFRALNRDGRSPRCGKPYDDPIHQVPAPTFRKSDSTRPSGGQR